MAALEPAPIEVFPAASPDKEEWEALGSNEAVVALVVVLELGAFGVEATLVVELWVAVFVSTDLFGMPDKVCSRLKAERCEKDVLAGKEPVNETPWGNPPPSL